MTPLETLTKNRASSASTKKNSLVLGFVAALGLVAATFVGANRASAFNLLGPRWGGTPTMGCCAELGVFTFTETSFLDPNDFNAFSNAYVSWNNVNSGANVNWVFTSNMNATAGDVDQPGVTWDGIANWAATGEFFDTNFVLLNIAFTAAYDWETRTGVAAHEIGHQMGLDHAGSCALMTPDTPTRRTCNVFTPQADDVAGINSMY